MKSKYLFFFSILTFFLVGCGGTNDPQGNGSSINNISKKEVKTIIGHVIDSPIWGLEYRCKGQTSKTTDQFGTFECESLPVTFKVGDLVVGHISTMPQDAKIYPQDIIGVSRDKVDDNDVVALTRFFQTLDDDEDIEETIKIEPSLAKKLSFKSEVEFANLDKITFSEMLQNKTGKTLVEKEAAQKHLRKNLIDGKNPIAIELSLLAPTLQKGLKSKALVNGIYKIDSGEVKSIISDDVIYTSSDKNIVTIESDGKITAHDEGTVEIRAKYGNLTATSNLRVTHTTFTKIEISTPTMAELTRLALGVGVSFQVKGFDSTDGIEKDVTSQIVWSSKSPLLSEIGIHDSYIRANGTGEASLLATLFDLTDRVDFDIKESEIKRVGIEINKIQIPLGSRLSNYHPRLLAYYADESNNSLNSFLGIDENDISWSVDDESILESSNKEFSSKDFFAKEIGQVTLTAKYKTFEDSVKLTVVDPTIDRISVEFGDYHLSYGELYIGDTTQMTVTGTYTDGTKKDITRSVHIKNLNPAIFSITPKGNITALKEGRGLLEITYTSEYGNNMMQQSITVRKVALRTLNAVNSYRNMDINTTVQLQVEGYYNNGTKKELTQNLTWTSDDENVVTVDNNGKITAKLTGNTIIHVEHSSGASTAFNIYVK